jgi:hypothetical protein
MNKVISREYVEKNYIKKSELANFFDARLKKYQEADDGIYKQPYLTRGELELVDRYKECREIKEQLLEGTKDVNK